MKISLLLDYVIPDNTVLYKHCNGAWEFFKSDRDFEDGNSYMSQKTTEDVHEFLERLVGQLIRDEANNEEKLVTIDYAIYSNH